MAVKIKTNQLAGYENTAFNYRYLSTTLTPLGIMQAVVDIADRNTLGRRVVGIYGADYSEETCFPCPWLDQLASFGRDYDRTYRILADEYYRTVDINDVARTKEKIDD